MAVRRFLDLPPAMIAVATVSSLIGWSGLHAQPVAPRKEAAEATQARPVPSDLFIPATTQGESYLRDAEARERYELDGDGLAVVVISTGIYSQHWSFEGQIAHLSEDPPAEAAYNDASGTGTHTSGIIAGESSGDWGGGMAPGAWIVPIRIYGENEGASRDDIIKVLDSIANTPTTATGARIAVVHLDACTSENHSAFDAEGGLDPEDRESRRKIRESIRRLRSQGVAVVVPAGNGYAGEQGMSFPAICPETISVGAVFDVTIPRDDERTPLLEAGDAPRIFAAKADRCVAFSQRLSEAQGKTARTDVFAPGFNVLSCGIEDEESLAVQTGTTVAAAHVSGAVLLLQRRFRDLTGNSGEPARLAPVDLIEECLRAGGVAFVDEEEPEGSELDDVPNSGAQFVRLDVLGAIDEMNRRYDADARRVRAFLLRHVDRDDGGQAIIKNVDGDAPTILGLDVGSFQK